MMSDRYTSWGRYPYIKQRGERVRWREQISLARDDDKKLLCFGNGRSYGDACLNSDGVVIDIRELDHFIFLDTENGMLRCESGVLLSEIIDLILPHGWFLEVTPGTSFVTLGGAIANDVHGKNHHVVGSFGNHVIKFELMRSDGSRLICSQQENSDLFASTIGGLGLTGLITWAEIALRKVQSSYFDVEIDCFNNLDGFFSLCDQFDSSHEYTVAWIDCLSRGSTLGRGVFMRGNHSHDEPIDTLQNSSHLFSIPDIFPFSAVNKFTLKGFNSLYYGYHQFNEGSRVQTLYSFLYPLDSILNWNRVYGRKGFLQYQCVVPMNNAEEVMKQILNKISCSGKGSFLAVLKLFGNEKSLGMLSFPRPGATLALDFPISNSIFELFDALDEVVVGAGGAIYPAKDARMSADTFQAGFPMWEEFTNYIDPGFTSDLWKRVTGAL